MPVKAPEIVEVEKAAGSHPVSSIRQPEPEVTVQVTTSQNDIDIVVSEENHQVDINISNDQSGNVAVSVSGQTIVEQPQIKVSALSLKSIRAKKEFEQANKANAKEETHLPTEAFNETDLLLQWTKYAQRLSDKGHKIMESLMLINDPKLQGTTVIHELPNESAKLDFESGKHDLVGYLRGKLHNHDIDIRLVVNESIDSRKAFTPQDRFNRLNEINPSLELLRKTFDLDF